MESLFNSELISLLAPPLVMCFVLVGIHCYLGIHVLARGVIFVDLSLAQVAALGSTFALALGFDHHSRSSYFVALGFTFLASALFAWARRNEKWIPQEALIGTVYAFASAAIVLVVDRMAHGAEHIKDVLVGQILWVTWADVLRTFLIYAAVAALHFVFRGPLLAASFQRSSSASNRTFWDFVFFALFGVVITSSVHVAGVLQVFSYLIVPAVLARPFFRTIRGQLLAGWTLGAIFSLIGLGLSHALDLPAGALMVVLFAVLPIMLSLVQIRGRGAQDG